MKAIWVGELRRGDLWHFIEGGGLVFVLDVQSTGERRHGSDRACGSSGSLSTAAASRKSTSGHSLKGRSLEQVG